MDKELFALKIMFHRLIIDPDNFGESQISFDNPKLAIKFLNYPTFLVDMDLKISRKTVMEAGAKGFPLKLGKSTVFRSTVKELSELIDFFNLKVNLTNLRFENFEELGFLEIALDSFRKFVEVPQTEDKFKKNMFSLYDDEERKIGLLEMSLSLIQRVGDKKTRKLMQDRRLDHEEKLLMTHSNGAKPLMSLSHSHRLLDSSKILGPDPRESNVKKSGVNGNESRSQPGLSYDQISQYFSKGEKEKSHKSILSGDKPPQMSIMTASNLKNDFPMRNELSQETVDMMISSGILKAPKMKNNFIKKDPGSSYFSKKKEDLVDNLTLKKSSNSGGELRNTMKDQSKKSILMNSHRSNKDSYRNGKKEMKKSSHARNRRLNRSHTTSEYRESHRDRPSNRQLDPEREKEAYIEAQLERERRIKKLRFEEKVKKLEQMPSIHEMAQAHYCPPPLFFEKKVIKKKIAASSRAEREFDKAYNDQYNTKVYEEGFQVDDKKRERGKKLQERAENIREMNEGKEQPPPNFIVLNENATRNLINDQNFQLKLNGGTLLDIFLNELAGLKNDSEGKERPFKIVVEHNQPYNQQPMEPNGHKPSLRNSSSQQNMMQKIPSKQGPKSSVGFNLSNNSSLGNGSNFWESQGTKKDPSELRSRDDKHRPLESIKESQESAHDSLLNEDESENKSGFTFPGELSYSASGMFNKDSALASNKFTSYGHNNKSKATEKSDKIYIEDPASQQKSFGGDFNSSYGDKFPSYQDSFGLSHSKPKSELVSGKTEGINLRKCIKCGKMIPAEKVIFHIRDCFNEDNKEESSKIDYDASGKGILSTMKRSMSNEFRESQYEDLGFSASKSSNYFKSGNDYDKSAGKSVDIQNEFKDTESYFDDFDGY